MLKLQMCKFVLLATGICGLKIPWIDVPVLLWVQQGGQFSLVRLNFQRVLLPVMVGGATDFLKPFRHCPLITPTQGEEIKPPTAKVMLLLGKSSRASPSPVQVLV